MRFCLSQVIARLFPACARKEAESTNLSELMERMSHELRTSLTGIVGYSEFVESTSTEPMVNFTAKIIRESGQNLARTSNSFFDLHRLTTGQLQLKRSLFSISELVRDVVRDHQRQARDGGFNLLFTCSDETYSFEISADKQRVHQVVDALVFSAVQQADKEQFIHVDVSFDENRTHVQFMLISSVAAMDDVRVKLHKEFWTDVPYKYKLQEGPGVELALVKALIRMMHGRVSYDTSVSDRLLCQLVVYLPMNDTQLEAIRP